VIDDRHAERIESPRDGLADPAHSNHADGTIAQRRLGEGIISLRPFSGAQKAFGLRKFTHRAKQQADRRVGNLFVKDVGRIGDNDAVRTGPFGVDMVVADAEARHLLKFGKLLQKISVDLVRGIGDRDRADFAAMFLDEGVLVLELKPMVEVHLALEAPHHHGLAGANHQHIRLFASHCLLLITPKQLRVFR
jgi:hypothetical protein